jgi:hypothetical protein
MRRVQLLDDGRRDTVQEVQVQVVHVGAVGKGGHAGAGESAIDCLLQLGAGVDLMSPIIAEDACGLQLCSLLPLSISALPASPTPSPSFHEPF